MSTLYIGRLGLDVAQDTFTKFDHSGETVSAAGQFIGTSLNQLQGLRQQLLGMRGRVEPVYWSEDDWAGGYYLIKDCSVTLKPVSLVTFDADFSVTLERAVRGFQLPCIETYTFGGPRLGYSNNPTSWVGQPSAATGQVFTGNTGLGSNAALRIGPGPLGTSGGVKTFVATASTSGQLFNSINQYTVAPANYYDFAATVKMDGRVVVGDQVPTIGNTADWELNNGLLKVTPGSTGMFKVQGPVYPAGTSWAAGVEFSPEFYSGGLWAPIGRGTTPPTIDSVSVMVNTAEMVSVRLVSTALFPSEMRDYVDLTLRRGAYHVEIATSSYLAIPWGLAPHSKTWATTSTQILWENSDNADGNRYAMFSNLSLVAAAATGDLDGGGGGIGASGTSKTYGQFGVGVVFGGNASSTSPNTATEVRNQYFAAMTESTRFVRP